MVCAPGTAAPPSLRVKDVGGILEEDGAVDDVNYVNRQNAQVVNGNQNWSTSVQGISPSYLSIRRWPVIAGRALSEQDDHDEGGRLPPGSDRYWPSCLSSLVTRSVPPCW